MRIVARRPAQQRQEIPKRLRQEAFLGISGDAGGAVALGEPRAVRPQDERHVRKRGRRPVERLINQNLLGGVGEVVGAANDVGDAHVEVVGHHAQVVGGLAVAAQQDKVFDLLVGHFHPARHQVVEGGAAFLRHNEAQRVALAALQPRRHFFRRQPPTTPVVLGRAAGLLRLLATLLELLRRAKARIGVAGGAQSLGQGVIAFEALRLEIRPLVPIQPQPAQAIEHRLDQLGAGAVGVSVFDAQDKDAALIAGEEPVEERRARAADVQEAGGRRRKPNPNFIFSHVCHARARFIIREPLHPANAPVAKRLRSLQENLRGGGETASISAVGQEAETFLKMRMRPRNLTLRC